MRPQRTGGKGRGGGGGSAAASEAGQIRRENDMDCSHDESNRCRFWVWQLPRTARESQYEARPGRTAAH